MAREKPVDGDRAMNEADHCLTCIVQGAICHGTKVSNGKCNSCHGLNEDGTRSRGIRLCRWSEPAKGIFTYFDHKEKYPKGKATGAEPDDDSDSDSEEFSDILSVFVNVRDIARPYVRQLLQAMVATAFDGNWVSDDAEANTKVLSLLAQAYWSTLDIKDTEQRAAAEELVDLLSNMLRLLDFIGYQEMLQLLPSMHPAYINAGRESSLEQEVHESIEVDDAAEQEIEVTGDSKDTDMTEWSENDAPFEEE